MGKRSPATMTMEQINEMRAAVLVNVISLIADADLLYVNHRYARTYAVSVLAIEETSKIPALRACLDEMSVGNVPDWAGLDDFLNSHQAKLLANQLYWASQREPQGLDETGSAQWNAAMAEAQEFNLRKQDGFYVTLIDGRVTQPSAQIAKADAVFALKLARISFDIFNMVDGASALRQSDPRAKYKANFRYSQWDEPFQANPPSAD